MTYNVFSGTLNLTQSINPMTLFPFHLPFPKAIPIPMGFLWESHSMGIPIPIHTSTVYKNIFSSLTSVKTQCEPADCFTIVKRRVGVHADVLMAWVHPWVGTHDRVWIGRPLLIVEWVGQWVLCWRNGGGGDLGCRPLDDCIQRYTTELCRWDSAITPLRAWSRNQWR